MADDMSWDHSAEDFQYERLLRSNRSLNGSGEGISVPRQQLYALLVDLRRSQDALIHHIRLGSVREDLSSSGDHQGSWAHKCRVMVNFISRFIFLFTVVLQVVDIVILTVIHYSPESNRQGMIIIGEVIMVILMVLNLIIAILASANLVNRLYHKYPTLLLLGQTYLSTVLLFAGIYMSIHQLNTDAWGRIKVDSNEPQDILLVELYCHFLFFSVSTGTLSGIADVVPAAWYSRLIVCIQMLLSYIYFGAVLSQAPTFVDKKGRIKPRRPQLGSSYNYGALNNSVNTTMTPTPSEMSHSVNCTSEERVQTIRTINEVA